VHDGRTGYLFTPGDPADLARKLRQIPANTHDYESMQTNCRSLYEEGFTESQNYQLLMKIYADVIRSVRSRPIITRDRHLAADGARRRSEQNDEQ
jgi:glycosyltransferase involved in cell wall biosynthesis